MPDQRFRRASKCTKAQLPSCSLSAGQKDRGRARATLHSAPDAKNGPLIEPAFQTGDVASSPVAMLQH